MASEYLMKLAREQQPPEEPKRELTPQEKRRNWWDYHKWYVIIGAVALVILVLMIQDIFFNREPQPDYQLAYIGSTYLPEDTVTALENALAEMGEDLNQDGQVLVSMKEYPLYASDATFQTAVAAQVQLTNDYANCESFFFLLEDPATFQTQFEMLAFPDGSAPEAGAEPAEDLWYVWDNCPVLTGLDLGTYTEYTMEGTIVGDNAEVLSGLYVARRVFSADEEVEHLEGRTALWQKLIEGAE